ncbi:MAG: TrmH family RNA methyltransferase [Lachnospiraceae bacterium]|nr:TrmH family RNA methyltransferase [Lachnospiraceae bacterium]
MPFKKYKKSDDYSYCLGLTLTFELMLRKKEKAVRIYVHSSINKNDAFNKLLALCEENGTEVIYSDKPFRILSDKENVFVIGVFQKFDEAIKIEKDANHLVLVNPSNAGNIGTILRTALGFGYKNIAIIRPGVDIYDPKAVRASMGAIFSLNIEYFDSFSDYQAFVGEREMYPFMLQAKIQMKECKPEGRFSLIFGNEATGLPEEFINIGVPVIIPITGDIDSLNLPIAAGIAMYHCCDL